MSKLCLYILLVISLNINAQNVYFVAVNGNDNNPGSIAQPFKKINTAANIAQPGDTVYVRGGTYRNAGFDNSDIWDGGTAVQITASGNPEAYITFMPYNSENVVIEFDGSYGILVKDASYITITGFEIKGIGENISYQEALNAWGLYQINGVTYDITGNEALLPLPQDAQKPAYYNGRGLVANSSHHINIYNNVVHDVPSSAIRVQQSDYVNVKGNHVYHNTYWTTQGVGAITAAECMNYDNDDGYKIIFEQNLVADNENKMISWNPNKSFITYVIDEGSGIFLTRNEDTYVHGTFKISNNISYNNGASGIMCHFTNNALISHNTVYHNGANNTGLPGGIGINNTNNVIIANNIIQSRPQKWAIGTTAQPNSNYTLTGNIVYNGNGSVDIYNNLPEGWLEAYPEFVDAAGYDFNLQPTSPAIGYGSPSYAEAVDYYGNLRDTSFPEAGAVAFGMMNTDKVNDSLAMIYPNPVNDMLTLRLQRSAEINIYTIQGKSLNLPLIQNLDNVTADFSGLPQGLYLININGNFYTVIKK